MTSSETTYSISCIRWLNGQKGSFHGYWWRM